MATASPEASTTTTIQVVVPVEHAVELKQRAADSGSSVSAEARNALAAYLEQTVEGRED